MRSRLLITPAIVLPPSGARLADGQSEQAACQCAGPAQVVPLLSAVRFGAVRSRRPLAPDCDPDERPQRTRLKIDRASAHASRYGETQLERRRADVEA